MELKKGYQGYKSFSYLKAGEDYHYTEPAPECNAFVDGGMELYPLTPEQEAKAKKIADEHIFISLHEHPFCFPKDLGQIMDWTHENRISTAYRGIAEGLWDCIFDNLMDGCCLITSKAGWKWQDVIYDMGMRMSDIAHQSFLVKCGTVDDIVRAKKEGKVAWVPVLESATPVENELDRVDILHGLGIRHMGITYSESNALGSGIKEDNDGGLTYLGRQVVERMNKVGIAIDCSHVGPQTTRDIIKYSTKPVIISHTGARALWDSKRLMLDDDMKACADKGGIIGIEAAPHTTITRNNRTHTIESFMEHFEYAKDLIGIDNVSFGPDTLYGDHCNLHKALAAPLSIKQTQQSNSQGNATEFPRVPYVKYMENPTECSHNILRWLVAHNYSEEDIAKVMGGNAMRVLKEVW